MFVNADGPYRERLAPGEQEHREVRDVCVRVCVRVSLGIECEMLLPDHLCLCDIYQFCVCVCR